MVLPVMLKSLRMSGVGECHFGVRLPEDSEVLQIRGGLLGSERETLSSLVSYIPPGTSLGMSVRGSW